MDRQVALPEGFTAQSLSQRRSPISDGWQWVLGILSAFGFLSLLAFGGFLYISGSHLSEEVAKKAVAEVSDHPVVQHYVGELRTSQMDWRAAMQDAQDNPGKSRGVIVMIGSKSQATLAFEQDADGRPVTAELILNEDAKFDLDMERSRWPRLAEELARGLDPVDQ